MKVLMAGASGMIGGALRSRLETSGHHVRTLVRHGGPTADPETYFWTGRVGSVPGEAIEWADAVASLSGAPLSHLPWTTRYRATILDSRTETTAALARAIAQADRPPAVWVSASAVGFYGNTLVGDGELDESSPSGAGFLAGVTKAWEAATSPASDVTRVVKARTGLVLGPHGATAPLIAATRVGLGARIGTGRQWWPWIGLEDEVRAWEFLLTADAVAGPVNLVGPVPARSDQVTRELAELMHRPYVLTLPRRVLRAAMGAAADELLLASQKVRPARLEEAGFVFLHPQVKGTLGAALGR
jgi:uncharacterized protein (TIGR01777 family)